MFFFANKKDKRMKAAVVFKDGSFFIGKGIGAKGIKEGELVFNTSITGYQETLTDPSYEEQIITFTFPHIGNVGTNNKDNESEKVYAKGLIVRNNLTAPSNHRAESDFNQWLIDNNVTGISQIDTRALVKKIKSSTGGLYGLIAYDEEGLDLDLLKEQAKNISLMQGKDLAATIKRKISDIKSKEKNKKKIVVIDYGVKQNILNSLENIGFDIIVLPAKSTAKEVLKHKPDGVFLSNGPGDPEATGIYAVPMIKDLVQINVPIFGICLGHQMLALALGAKTVKMATGHRGANHPVKDLRNGKVIISSQNHGFMIDESSLPQDIKITHRSLFDGSIEGIKSLKYKAFSVQYHPEASPGPQDCLYHFEEFLRMVSENA